MLDFPSMEKVDMQGQVSSAGSLPGVRAMLAGAGSGHICAFFGGRVRSGVAPPHSNEGSFLNVTSQSVTTSSAILAQPVETPVACAVAGSQTDKVVVAGGWTGSFENLQVAVVDLAQGTSNPNAATFQHAHGQGTCGSAAQKVFFIGNYIYETAADPGEGVSVEVIDTTTNAVSMFSLSIGRTWSRAASVGRWIFVGGGCTSGIPWSVPQCTTATDSVVAIDTQTNTVHDVGDLPQTAGMNMAGSDGSAVYFAGGKEGASTRNFVVSFNFFVEPDPPMTPATTATTGAIFVPGTTAATTGAILVPGTTAATVTGTATATSISTSSSSGFPGGTATTNPPGSSTVSPTTNAENLVSESDGSEGEPPLFLVLGIILGVVCCLLMVAGAFFFVHKRQKRGTRGAASKTEEEEEEEEKEDDGTSASASPGGDHDDVVVYAEIGQVVAENEETPEDDGSPGAVIYAGLSGFKDQDGGSSSDSGASTGEVVYGDLNAFQEPNQE